MGKFENGHKKYKGQGKRGPGKFSEFKQSFLEVADAIKWKENLIKLIKDGKGGVNTKHFKWFTEQILKIVPKDVNLGNQEGTELHITISDKFLPDRKGNGDNGEDTSPDTD